MSEIPKGQHFTLVDLLKQKRIAIPPYQRTYDWDSNTVEQLLECLDEHRKLHKSTLQQNPYFLGNLMVHKEDDIWWLVDGQQRLVTVTIIAAAIRDICIERELFDLAYEIQHDLIQHPDTQENFLTPRKTKDPAKSPRELLKPLQVPKDQHFEILFSEPSSTTEEEAFFDLINEVAIPWPINQDDVMEIKDIPGAKFTFCKNYKPGERVNRLLGVLEITPEEEIGAGEAVRFFREERTDVINKELSGKWDNRRRIPGHYENARYSFRGSKPWIEEKLDKQNLIQSLKEWKDLITYLAFTTTSFIKEEDAIYYFGKLNDSSTSMQLNVGDLMRHNVALCVKQDPVSHNRNDDIDKAWDEVEDCLKEDTQKDYIPIYLYSWLASQGRRESRRNVYSTIKKDLNKHKSEGTWDKESYFISINRILETAKKFRQICEPRDGDNYQLSMSSMGKVAEQHMPLFLAGLRALEANGLKKQMTRLIKIYEYMTVKGVEIPSAIGIGNSISGPERYAWIDHWCKLLNDETNEFEGSLTKTRANDLLDDWASKVKNRCDQVWNAATLDDGTDVSWSKETLKEIQVNQGVAKLILTRIELTNDASKSWDLAVEVEHVLPQKWTKEWNDETKGGKFTEEEGRTYKEYLGNRSLLPPLANGKLSNKSFKDKQNMADYGYDAHASWYITGDLSSDKVSTWNPEEIKKRTEKLAGEIIEIYDDEFIGLQ